MKRTILGSALLAIMCTQVSADPSPTPVTTTPLPKNTSSPTLPTSPANTAEPATPSVPEPTRSLPAATLSPTVTPVVDCNYKIAATTKTVEQSLVVTWAEKATVQSFSFDPSALDSQMSKLQSCFTEQGWMSFNSALQKSGNLEAIKSQKLTVNSQIDGPVQVLESTDNQWKIGIPLQVVYQNDKEKVTQQLNIKLNVGRKITGDLGINQIIATPRGASDTTTTPQTPPTSPTTTPASPSTSPVPSTSNAPAESATTVTTPATPQTSTPAATTPQTNTPAPATPQTNVPAPATPQTNVPAPATPQTNTPAPATPQTNVPAPATPQTNMPVSATPQTNVPVPTTPTNPSTQPKLPTPAP